MEGLIQYWPYWAMYLVFAVIGLWCWKQLFFWLLPDSEWRSFWTIPGAVLLFTPAPLALDSSYFAPAVFVVILDALSGKPVLSGAAVLWLLSGFCIGMLVLAVRHILINVRSKLTHDDGQGNDLP